AEALALPDFAVEPLALGAFGAGDFADAAFEAGFPFGAAAFAADFPLVAAAFLTVDFPLDAPAFPFAAALFPLADGSFTPDSPFAAELLPTGTEALPVVELVLDPFAALVFVPEAMDFAIFFAASSAASRASSAAGTSATSLTSGSLAGMTTAGGVRLESTRVFGRVRR